MLPAMDLIEFVRDGLISEGLQIGNPKPLTKFTVPLPVFFLLGAGVIAAGGWLLALFAEPFFANRKWRLKLCILMVLALAAWAGGLILMPVFARKLFALAGAIFIPSLGIVLVIKQRMGSMKALPRAVIQLLAMSVFTVAGGMMVSALLADTAFMVKLDHFVGVKVAHVIPLALVPFILWLREKDWFGLLSGTVKSSVRFWQLGVSFVLLAALALYILRTGNDSPEAVFDLELKARQMLDSWLGVRPRTTEFLIGHPLMLVMLYYGYQFKMFPVLMIGIMGQVSLINTYAHIHTPIMISLQRSFHGLWIGMAIGIIMILVIELIRRWLRRSASLKM